MSRLFFLTLSLMLVSSPMSFADPKKNSFVVIVNKANGVGTISKGMLRTIYLRKISRWPSGAEIAPIDMPSGSQPRAAFSREILKVSLEDLAVYWIDQHITRSIRPPKELETMTAIKEQVAARPGAIAYIPLEAVDGTIKALEVQ